MKRITAEAAFSEIVSLSFHWKTADVILRVHVQAFKHSPIPFIRSRQSVTNGGSLRYRRDCDREEDIRLDSAHQIDTLITQFPFLISGRRVRRKDGENYALKVKTVFTFFAQFHSLIYAKVPAG